MNNSRRKSMRLAADPCLGFYRVPTSNSPNIPPPSVPDVPPIEVLISDDSRLSDTDTVEPIVSVDAFLRRTALARTKAYGKKRKRLRVKDSTDPDETDEKSPEAETPPSRSTALANPTHRQSKPLKKRLLRAAVLSNAEPEEWLLHDDPIPLARKPLPLVEQPPPRESVQIKRRTWSLVDPRKAVAARPNSFTNRGKAPPFSTKIDTLSGWRATYGKLDGETISNKKIKASESVASQAPLKCPPLSFVSLREAEKSYSLMRLPPHKVKVEDPKTRDTATLSMNSGRVPLKFTSVDQYHSSPTICIAPEVPSMESSCTPLAFITVSANPAFDTRLASLNTSEPTSSPGSVLVHCDNISASPPRSPPRGTDITLKPLASFFDQFLQTARAETQLEQTKKKKVPRKNRHRRQAIPSQRVGTCKTVRTNPSVQHHAHASYQYHRLSPSYSPNAFTNHVPAFDVPPSMTTQFRPSSPDACRVLQPTPYQVVLPSTPPTSCRPESINDNGHDLTWDAVDSSVNLFCFNKRTRV
ncbi:hypothetical protein B0H12DRAFT_392918 [Mycena haematopus]|nr:hypothetical protein B0H12DRAFT_392918 [Mycena haematopus]